MTFSPMPKRRPRWSTPTDLKALTAGDFDRLARHGFEAADTTLTTYATAVFSAIAALE